METIIMENQMDKKMKSEMETGIILGCIRVTLGYIARMEKKMGTNIS